MGIVELKRTIPYILKIHWRKQQAEERITELQDRSIEIMQAKEQEERIIYSTITGSRTCIIYGNIYCVPTVYTQYWGLRDCSQS